MRLTGEFMVAAMPAEVWEVFMDPARLCRVMPGCEEARQLEARRYEAVLATKVQFMTIRARAVGTVLEFEELQHVTVELVGETLAMAGAFRALMTVDLEPIVGDTRVHYSFDITMFGRLGSLGEPLVRSTAQALSSQFAENVASLFRRGESNAGA